MRSVVRKLRRLARICLGTDIAIKPDVTRTKTRFGSTYGGWDVVIDDLDRNSIVYSFGVGEDATFDTALIDRFGLIIHAFDPTPKSIQWVKKQGFSDHFVMHEYGLAARDGTISFHPPENPDHVSHTLLERPETCDRAITVPVKRLSTILGDLGHDRIDVLKMDIEGAEYEVVDDLRESEIRPRQILVEFHHRFPNVGTQQTLDAVATLRAMGYGLFSVSTSGEEFGFILTGS